ncbi:ESPR-type extended signal peptide-containing protein [Megasphaera sp. WILCCON 0056]|uniref:ESPR-type extended signal peptide-containing protein n=1 Tax=Megasphaera sp. WILCCON 0056 TaxID=3345340 RepID=UPI003A80057E
MNKTYKVIYNRTRCMYQVVSELAKGHTKSETPEMLKSLFSKHSGLTRGIVMAVLSMSLAMPVGVAVQAEDTAGTSGTTTSTSDTTTSDATDTTTTDTTVTVKDGATLVGSGAVSVSSSADTNNTTTITIAVPTDGKVEAGNTGLVTGGTVYTAVNAEQTAREAAVKSVTDKIGTLDANGNYVQKDASVSSNLSTLDTQVKTNADAISKEKTDREAAVTGVTNTVNSLSDSAVKYDADSNKTKVTLAGEGGTTITNIKEGALSDSSMDAVTGKQLYAEQTARESADTTLTNKIGSLSANGNYIQMNASVFSNFSTLDTQMKTNADAISKERTDRTDAISALKTELTSDSTNSSLASKANVNASNIGIKIDTSSETTEEAKKKKQEDNAKLWGEALGIGTIADGNEELLTGGTLYTELRPSADGFYIYNGKSTAYNLLALDSAINALGVEKVTDNSGNITYVSNLYKYFKANPETTTNDDGTVTYAIDADAQGTNSVAIGPNAKTARYTTTTLSGDTTTTTETAADHAVAIGDGATVNAAGDQGVALGNGAVTGEAETTSTDGTSTTTTDAKGGASSVAIGETAKANGNQAMAFGKGASVLNPSGTAVSTGSIAIGSGAKVDGGDNSIAFGTNATVNKVSDAMALGNGATINKTATGSLALGKSAVTGGVDKSITLTNGTTGTLAAAGGEDSIAIGNGAVSEGDEALALGKGAKVTNGVTGGDSAAAIVKTGSAAIGDGATVANSENSMAIGKGANITEGTDTTVIGSGAKASQTKQAFVAGYQASSDSSAESSVAIGDNASTHSARTTAIGYKAEAHNADSIAIGSEAKTDDNGGGIAIGTSTSAAYGGLAIGKSANALNDDSLAIGNGAVADVNKSISIGYNAGVGTAEDNKEKNGSLVAIGTSAGNNVKGMQNVAIGASAGSSVLSSNNIAIGTNAGYGIKNVTSTTDTNPQNGYNISIGAGANYTEGNTNQNIVSSIAIGHATHAVNRAVALGEGASAQGDSGMALGNSATSSGSGSIAIGNTASASNGNIALGAGAIATGTPTGTGKWTNTAAPSYYISVGGKGNASDSTITLRRISNVADGSADQDVVTVKQLQKVSDDLENTIKGIDTSQLKTYSTTEIDNKIAEVNQNIKDSGVKYFSINSASQSTNSNNTGANGDGDADAMAIGPNAKASSVKALAIGNNVSASGTLSIAIGTANNPSTDTTTADNPHPTSSEGTSSVAIGTSAIAQTDNSIAIGTRATTYTANTTSSPVTKIGIQSIAIGYGAETRDNNAIAFGTGAKANSAASIAIGDNAQALNENAVVIGTSSTAYGTDSVTLGKNNTNNGKGVMTTGNSNSVTNSQSAADVVQNSGIYGSLNKIQSVSSSNSSNAITDVYAVGNSNKLNQVGEKNVLNDVSIMGNNNTIENGTAGAYTQTVKQIAVVGSGNTVKGNTDINTTTWGTVQKDTILGYNNTVDATKQSTPVSNLQILGNDVTATLGNSVYLGTGSSATASKSATAEAIQLAKDQGDAEAIASDEYKNATTEAEQTAIKQKYEAQHIHTANIVAMDKDGISAGIINYDTDYTYGNDSSYAYAGSNPTGVVTVGSKDATRRIQNVSAGLVGPNSTDAVNGSQLYALTRQIRFGGDNSSFGDTAAGDTNVVARGSNEKISITGGSDAVTSSTTDGTTTYTVDSTKLTGNNIAVVANTDTNALHVQLASNLKDLNTTSLGSGSGNSYKETIKLDGTDSTNGGTLVLKDANGINGVTLRTSGTTTTKDATGAATTRLLVNDKTVATTDDGLIVAGDSGTNSVLKLNSTLTVKGGINSTNAANRLNDDNNNIGVTSDGKGNLTVKLSKDIALGNYQSGTESADKSGTLRINGGSYYSLDNGSALSFYKSAGTANGSSKSPAEGDKLMATLGIYQGGYLGLYDSNGANEEMLYNGGTTNGIHRLTYKDIANNKTYDLATLNDYTNFKDDAGHSVSIALDKSLTLKGGASTTDVENADKWTTGNISIVSSADTDNGTANGNGTMTIRLAKNLNLGTDGSVVTGATTINNSGLTNGSTTLNGTGLTIANGPSITTSGITANGKITSVTAGEANNDAANYGQVKAAKTILTQGSNTKLTDKTDTDGHHIYTVNVDNLSYKAGTDATAKTVTLSNGLTFQNGKNTTAVAGDNGTITYNLNDKIELGAETDSNNHIVVDGTKGLLTLGMNATINGNAGTASIGGVSIGKSGSDQVITGLTNKTWTVGTTQAVDGRAATENQLQNVADNLNTANTEIDTLQHGFKVRANGDTATESTVKADDALSFIAGDNARVTTTKDSKQITISVDNLSVKDNNGTAQSVKLADGLNFQDGTNTTAKVGTSGTVTYDLKDSITLGTAADEANRIIVNGTNGTITVGNLATINGNAGTASIGGVSIGKSGSDQIVTGLSNKTWVVGTTKAVSGRAATEDQLQSVSDAAHTNADNITTLQQGFTVTANNDTEKKSTIKAGDTLNIKAGKNVQISTTAESKSIEVAVSDTPEFTTVKAKDANGNVTTVSGNGVTIASTGTGAQSVSLTSEGLDNGNHVIKHVASGGTERTNAANIGDLQDAISNASTTTTNIGFNVKGDDATAKKVKLGKQLNVVGGVNDSSKLSDGNIGVVTTADGDGNATLTVKLNKEITLDSVKTGNTTLNTSGVTNGNMSLTGTGMTITDTDASKQVSVTTNGVSMGSQRIQNVADATSDTDAATLKQVKNARTVVAKGDNVKEVTSSEDTATHQITYTVNVDNLSVKANDGTAKEVALKTGLNFKNGTNTTAYVGDNGEVKYDLNSTLTDLTSVTAGNSTLDTNGLTISGGPKFTKNGIDAGSQKITGVANGEKANDAVNKGQLDDLQNQVSGGWNLSGNNAEGNTVTAKIGAGKTVTYTDGIYTKSVVTNSDNATVKVDVTTGTFGSGTGDKVGTVSSTANGLTTTQDVANAINNASWTIQNGNNTGNAQQVKAGDTVSLKAGDNLSLDQNGKEFTYKLNKTLQNMTSVTAVDDKQNTAVLNGEGLKVFDKDGNSLTQHATEIRLHDATKAATDTTTDVVLNKQGLQNGGHTITGVANGTVDANSQDAVNGGQLYELQQKVTNGWKITGNDTTKASNIGNDKTVSFVNGDNSYIKAKVDTTNTGATVSYTAQTASLMKNAEGKAALNGTTDGLVTGTNLTNVLNSLSWTAQSSKTGTGQNNGSTAQSITAGSQVGFIAGDNMILTQDGTNFTYALNSSLTGMNTIAFTGLGTGVSNLTIGLQNGGGANPDKGYYITGLSNTKWNQSNYEGSRAATEAQLREAIDKVSAATGTGGFGLTADEGANNGGEKKVSQTLGSTIAIQGDGTYGADGTVVKQGNISTVAYTDNAGPTGAIKVKLNKDIDLSEAGSLTIGASKVSADSIVLDNTSDAAKKIALNSTAGIASIGGVTVNGAEKTVNGLSNTTWNGTAVSGRAATENQLVDAINEVKTQAANSELHIKKGVYAIGKDSQGQDVTDTKGKNSVSIDVVNAKGAVDGQVVINDVAKASELGTVGELADNLKNPNGGPTTVVQAVNKVNQKVDESLKTVNGDVTNAVTEAKKHTEVKSVDSDNNVTIDGTTTNADGGTVYKLGLNKDHLNLGNVHVYGNEGRVTAKTVESETVKIDDQTRLDKTGLTTGNTTVANNRIVVGGDNGIKIEANGGQQTISGLTNTDWTGTAVHGRAATEDQLAKAISSATTTAAQNEQHIKSGTYNIQTTTDDKGNKHNSVTMDIVDGTGKDKGTVVINDVAKASDVGDTDKLAADIKNQNGGQPQATSVVEAVNNLNEKVNTRVGDNKYSAITSKDAVQDGDNSTTAIAKLNNRMTDIYHNATQHSSVAVDGNLTLDDKGINKSGGTEYKIGLNKDQINLGNLTIKGNEGSIEAKSIKSDSFTAGDTVVNKDGVKVGDKSALTGDSLKVNGKTYVDDKGVNANGQVIRNVGEGKDDGDAVNVKQVNDLAARQGEAIDQNTAHINQLGQAVNKLGTRLNRVGAGAAALAALHPGTYDPNDKWDFSAGVGHYHDANAVAIGAYYHPNDTTILSIGGSMGGGENMVNAGITWKMGRSGREQAAPPVVVRKAEAAPVVQQAAPVRPAPVVVPVPAVTPAPVTTPAPVKSVAPAMPVQAVPAVTTPMTPAAPSNDTAALAQILARQTAILEKLAQNQSQAAPSAAVAHGDDIFPDVPDNHWAYAYVAKLEKAGALKGFKHPAVLKSPMMTRDDFASVLYTAMANGATTNPALNGDDSLNRLAQEFKAELKNVKM